METTATTTPSFLGNPMEICLVTRDYKRTISGLHALGIGPWRCYSFTPSNTTNQTYRGQASDFTLRVCFAELSPTMVYEVIDAYSEVLLGYYISDTENFEAQYNAYRMAIQNSW